MHNARDTAAALAVLLALAIGMALPWIASCTPLQRIDEALWGTAQPEPDTPTTPGGLAPAIAADPPPPIVEAVASLAAALGFGGMATWVRRVRRNGDKAMKEAQRILDELRTRLTAIEKTVPFGPTA